MPRSRSESDPVPPPDARAVPRKERVLHARIPEQLDDTLKDEALRHGLSVSTMVRNILMNTFDLVGTIVTDSTRLAYGQRPSEPPPPEQAPPSAATDVLVWQPGVINRNGVCDRCNAVLKRGSQAAIGMPMSSRPVFLCPSCLSALQQDAQRES